MKFSIIFLCLFTITSFAKTQVPAFRPDWCDDPKHGIGADDEACGDVYHRFAYSADTEGDRAAAKGQPTGVCYTCYGHANSTASYNMKLNGEWTSLAAARKATLFLCEKKDRCVIDECTQNQRVTCGSGVYCGGHPCYLVMTEKGWRKAYEGYGFNRPPKAKPSDDGNNGRGYFRYGSGLGDGTGYTCPGDGRGCFRN